MGGWLILKAGGPYATHFILSFLPFFGGWLRRNSPGGIWWRTLWRLVFKGCGFRVTLSSADSYFSERFSLMDEILRGGWPGRQVREGLLGCPVLGL